MSQCFFFFFAPRLICNGCRERRFFYAGFSLFLGSSFIFKNGPIIGFEPLGEKEEVSEGGRKARWAVF